MRKSAEVIMASQTLVSSELDLEYNRYGRLSPEQRAKLERREVLYHLISIFVIGVGVMFVLVGLFDNRPPLLEKFVAILFATPFLAVGVRFYLKPLPFPEGVQKVQ